MKHFDWRSGVIAGVVFALVVFAINVAATDPVNWLGSVTAGLKQFVYTVFVGSWLFGFAQWISRRFESTVVAITVSTIVCGSLASALILGMHSLRGTPEPLLSSLPSIIIGILILPFVLKDKRKESKHYEV